MLSNDFCIEPGSLTDVDIRKGYRAAAWLLHPDKGGKSEEFQETGIYLTHDPIFLQFNKEIMMNNEQLVISGVPRL